MILCRNNQKYKGGPGGFRKHIIWSEIQTDTNVCNDHGIRGVLWESTCEIYIKPKGNVP